MGLKKIVTLFIIALFLSACNPDASDDTGLSFPSELFTIKTIDGNECMVQVEQSKIETTEIQGKIVHTLTLQGKMPSGCGSLSMRIDPPTVAKQIKVYLSSSQSSSERINENSKPFYISMPINIMVEGYYTIVINDTIKLSYSYFNNPTSGSEQSP